jgi:hypothetical protein
MQAFGELAVTGSLRCIHGACLAQLEFTPPCGLTPRVQAGSGGAIDLQGGFLASSPNEGLEIMLAASRLFMKKKTMLTSRQLRRATYAGDAEAQRWLVHKMAMGACARV